MNTAVTLFGKLIRLFGRIVKILAGVCTFLLLCSMLGFLYKLINMMIPGVAYQIMFLDNIIGKFFVWYYTKIYLRFPLLQTFVYYFTTWGSLVLIPLFRILSRIFVFLSNKLILWGTNIMNRGLVGKAQMKTNQNNALVQELNRQTEINQQLREENMKLRTVRPAVQTYSSAPKKPGVFSRLKAYTQRLKEKEEQEALEQEDAWGKWSRRK